MNFYVRADPELEVVDGDDVLKACEGGMNNDFIMTREARGSFPSFWSFKSFKSFVIRGLEGFEWIGTD